MTLNRRIRPRLLPLHPLLYLIPEDIQLQKCTLYFFDINSLRLAGEERELDLSQDVNERLKQTITELLGNSTSGLYQTIPKGTLLYEVYVDEQSTVYLDFSHHLKDEHIGGTTSEALTIAAILRTVRMNFADHIRKVQILIEGLETDTIGGHIDISKPLSLSLDLEVVSRQVEPMEVESPEAELVEEAPAKPNWWKQSNWKQTKLARPQQINKATPQPRTPSKVS